jgi:hypothetical protein
VRSAAAPVFPRVGWVRGVIEPVPVRIVLLTILVPQHLQRWRCKSIVDSTQTDITPNSSHCSSLLAVFECSALWHQALS